MSENIGVLVEWDDERGFGFIQHASGKRIFVHISVVRAPRRPVVGDTVGFNVMQDENGRFSAGYMRMQDPLVDGEGAKWTKPKSSQRRLSKTKQYSLILSSYLAIAAVFFVLLGAGKVFLQYGFAWTVLIYLVASLISFFLYRVDKRSAQSGNRRIPERDLHLLELLGGWPGAAIAQIVLHHKNQKIQYQQIFIAIIFMHGVVWLDYLLGWAMVQNLILPIFNDTRQAINQLTQTVLAWLSNWLG